MLRFVGCATKLMERGSVSLLRLKSSRARVFQSGLKTGGGVTAGGARGTIVDVASKSS
jgi:hypothetical protein